MPQKSLYAQVAGHGIVRWVWVQGLEIANMTKTKSTCIGVWLYRFIHIRICVYIKIIRHYIRYKNIHDIMRET